MFPSKTPRSNKRQPCFVITSKVPIQQLPWTHQRHSHQSQAQQGPRTTDAGQTRQQQVRATHCIADLYAFFFLTRTELYTSQTTTHDFENCHTKPQYTMTLFTMQELGDAITTISEKGKAPHVKGKAPHSMHSATSQRFAIMDAGNTEICEIINVEPKWQCKVCLKHCSTRIIYCTCGHLMTKDSVENRKYISAVLDTFSIPNFYIRKHRPHGHRYGKAPGCKDYCTANQLAKKCRKKKYDSIHDRYIRDKTFRKAMIEVGPL